MKNIYRKGKIEIVEAKLSAEYLLTAGNSQGGGGVYAPSRKEEEEEPQWDDEGW